MHSIDRDIAAFREAREHQAETSRQIAALQLLCGIDLAEALMRTGETRDRTLRRIRRAMERERLKGARGQAGYDLDRHIALKRSLERLGGAALQSDGTGRKNGARRRRVDVEGVA